LQTKPQHVSKLTATFRPFRTRWIQDECDAHCGLREHYEAIMEGNVEEPSTEIQDLFGVEYVVSGERHRDFKRQARADPQMTLVYQDPFNSVWRVADFAH
jgi:hypothetical protein